MKTTFVHVRWCCCACYWLYWCCWDFPPWIWECVGQAEPQTPLETPPCFSSPFRAPSWVPARPHSAGLVPSAHQTPLFPKKIIQATSSSWSSLNYILTLSGRFPLELHFCPLHNLKKTCHFYKRTMKSLQQALGKHDGAMCVPRAASKPETGRALPGLGGAIPRASQSQWRLGSEVWGSLMRCCDFGCWSKAACEEWVTPCTEEGCAPWEAPVMEWERAELLPGLKALLNWVCHREML